MPPSMDRIARALAATLALSAAAARAEAPWEGPPFSAEPATLLAAARALPAAKGQGVDLLLEEGHYALDARGAVAVTHRMVLRVLTADAAQRWSRLEAPWAPWHQDRPEVRARVVTAQGQVFPLDPATLSEHPVQEDAGDTYSDLRAVTGPLPGVGEGAVIEVVTVTRETQPAFEAGTLGRFEVARPIPVRQVRFSVEAPAALPLRWAVRGTTAAAREAVKDGVRRITLERRDVAALPDGDPAAPPDLAQGAYVAFSWGKSWAALGEAYGAVAERQLAGADLSAAARAALGEGPRPGREEAVRRLVAWLHASVRYTGLELGQAALIPSPPAATLQRRYGDCKDLSLLLVGLLRAAGLEGRLVLVQTQGEDVLPELPGLNAFDHVVVRVEGSPAIWVDPTDNHGWPGQLPPAVQGRLGLPAGAGAKELVRTPQAGAADNTGRVVRELHVPLSGLGRLVEERRLTGALAAAERAYRDQIPVDRREEAMEAYARQAFRAAQVLSTSVAGAGEPAASLEARVEVAESEVVQSDGDSAELQLSADGLLDGLPLPVSAPAGDRPAPPAPARRSDLYLRMPYHWELVYRIFPPDGFRARPLPAGATERFGPAQLSRTFTLEKDGSITAAFTFDTGGRRIPAADADALGRRARELRRTPGPLIRLERTAAAMLAAGQVPQALDELRALVARHPDEQERRVQLAVALQQLGFTEPASAEARAAATADPDLAWAQRVLAFTLEHDALGRFHGKGFARDEAIAAYRKARDLDPEHGGTRAALAELLARDADGNVLPGRGLDEALAELASIRKDLSDPRFEPRRLDLLLDAGRFDEAEKLARGLATEGQDAAEAGRDPRDVRVLRDAALVASVAALRGVDAAEEEARGLGEGRRMALREAARILVHARRYAPAQALLEAAARNAPDAAELRQRADLLQDVKPWNELAEPAEEDARLVRKLLLTAVKADPAAEAKALLARGRVTPDLIGLAESSLAATAYGVRHAARREGLRPDGLLDLVLTRLELLRDGEPATGLRVRLHSPMWQGGGALYLVREGRALKALCSDAAWPVLVAEVDRLAGAGDTASARRFLEWARDALPGDPADAASPAGILAALWPPGAEGGAPELRRSAAALLAFVDKQGRGVPVLAEARERATDPRQRRALGFALAQAHQRAGHPEEVRKVTADLLADDPAARPAFQLQAVALARLHDAAGLDAAAQAILARLPGDPEVLQVLGDSKLSLGDLEGAARAYRQAIDGGRAPPGVYNNAAWLEVFRPAPAKEMLAWARRATQPGEDPVSLNTLAVVYGVLGQPAEARGVLFRSLAAAGDEPPGPGDWLVQGLVAEGWGLRDVAVAAYRKVEQDNREDPTAPWVLAQRRLGSLGSANPVPASAPAAVPPAAPAPPAKAPAAPAAQPAPPSGMQKPAGKPAPGKQAPKKKQPKAPAPKSGAAA